MTFDPSIPQPTDIPLNNQPDFFINFQLLNQYWSENHVQLSNTILDATSDNPCLITSVAHGLSPGDSVTVYSMKESGGDPLVPWPINGNTYFITIIDDDSFTIPVDTTDFGSYLASSGDFSSSSYNYGYHQKLYFPNTSPNPNLSVPFSSLYTSTQDQKSQVSFQNGPFSNDFNLITDPQIEQLSTGQRSQGFVTPWGFTINSGSVTPIQGTNNFSFPIPLTSSPLFFIWTPLGNTINASLTLTSVSNNGFTLLANNNAVRQLKFQYMAGGI